VHIPGKPAKASFEKNIRLKMSKIVGPETMPCDKTIDVILEKLDKVNDPAIQPREK